jgi:hypothetical protein
MITKMLRHAKDAYTRCFDPHYGPQHDKCGVV